MKVCIIKGTETKTKILPIRVPLDILLKVWKLDKNKVKITIEDIS